MSDDKLQQFLDLAVRTGRIHCATDVYEALMKLPGVEAKLAGHGILRVEHCPYMPPGTMMAARTDFFSGVLGQTQEGMAFSSLEATRWA